MKKLLLLLLVSFIHWSLILAQVDTSIYNLTLKDLAQIKISTPGRNIMTVLTAPSNIITITDKEIYENNYKSLRDLLNDIPQIIIQHVSSAENEDIYTINGITGNEKFLILLDGVRINAIAGSDNTIGENYSLANVKRVEIILNPTSVLYGADAFNAIINIITYKPEEKKGIEVSANRGNYNTYDAYLVTNYKLKNLGFTFVSKYFYSDGPFFPIYYPDLYNWYYRYEKTGEVISFGDTIQAPIGIKPWDMSSKATNFRAKLFYKNIEIGMLRFFESHSTSLSGKPQYSIYCKEAHYNTLLDNFYLKHNLNSKSNNIQLYSLINLQKFKILPTSAFVNRYTNFNVAYKYENTQNLHWEENLRIKTKSKQTWNLGFAVDLYDIIPKTGDLPVPYDETKPYDQQQIYYFGTNVQDTAGNSLVIYQDIYRIKYYNLSTYTQISHYFSDKLYIIAGLRGEYNSRFGFTLLPRFSLIYLPSNYWSIKIMYGKSFLAPPIHKAYQHFGSFIPVQDSLGGIIGLKSPFWHLTSPNLTPEYKDSYEINLIRFLNDNLYFKLNLFYNNLYNLITRVIITDTTFHNVPVDKAWVLRNTGNGNTYGGTISLYNNFKINDLNIKSSLSYTYIYGRINNLPPQFSPKHSIKTKITINYLDQMNLTIGGQYRSWSFYYPGDTVIKSPPYFVLYASGNALVIEQKWMSLWLTYRAYNLINSRYYNLSDGSVGPSPQKPLELLVGLKATF